MSSAVASNTTRAHPRVTSLPPGVPTSSAVATNMLTSSHPMVSLNYHAVPRSRLSEQTIAGLISAGVPQHALGTRSGATFALTGCVELTALARDHLPPALGGLARTFNASPATADLVARAYPRSPGASPEVARTLFSPPGSPGRTPLGPGTPPSSADRCATLRALAASLGAAEASAAVAATAAAASTAAQTALAALPRRSSRFAPVGGHTGGPSGPALGVALDASVGPPMGDGVVPAAEAAAEVAAEAAAEAADLARAIGAATQAAADAGVAGAALARDNARVADLEAALSTLSVGFTSPLESASLDNSRVQQHIVASTQNISHTAEAIAFLTAHRRKFNLTYQALLKAGGGTTAALLSDFPLLVLVPAVHAARAQEHGLDVLRAAVFRHAGLAGMAGTRAVDAFASEVFDANAARAILEGQITATVSPLDLCLGVLPVTQLGLHFWYRLHSYRPPVESTLLDAARSVSFVTDGVIDPSARLQPLMAAWAQASSEGDEIPHVAAYFHIVEALHRDSEVTGSAQTAITILGVPTTWTTFACGKARDWRRDHGGEGPNRQPSPDDLRELLWRIQDFAEARARDAYDPGSLPPPELGGGGSAYAARVATYAMPPIPPPGAPGPPSPPRRHGGGARGAGRGRGASGSQASASSSPPSAPPPEPPAHIRATAYVIPDGINILSAIPLLRAGWIITLGAGTGQHGAFITIPGRAGKVLLRRDARGNTFVDLVAHDGGWMPVDGSGVSPRPGAHSFLLDTGAEVSLVGTGGRCFLRELGAAPRDIIKGIGNISLGNLESGILLIVTPPPRAMSGGPSKPWRRGRGRGRVPAGPETDPPGVTAGVVRYVSLQRGDATGPSDALAVGLPACAVDVEARADACFRADNSPLAPEEMFSVAPVVGDLDECAPDDGLDTLAVEYYAVRVARTSAFAATNNPQLLADRFNLHSADAIRTFIAASPHGVAEVLQTRIDNDADYSQGYASAATLKAPPIHATRYTLSTALRDAMPHGHVWWTDISNTHPPDFAGHTLSRLFAEERTNYALTFYSSRKDSRTLIEHIKELSVWVGSHVPGGRLQCLRCDFASEAVRQGHGDAIYTAELSAYCDATPGFRVIPVAPRSQALNRVENTWGRIHGGTAINARRARIGPSGWSLMERGSVFQHNHRPAPFALDPASRQCSRSKALTLIDFDVSTMLGHVGQTGWTHRPDGKANALRVTADPVLYVCPATSLHAQIVFNLRAFKLTVVRDVALAVDPFGCALLLSSSSLYLPAGCAVAPTPDVYAARLNAILTWRPVGGLDHSVVIHDPVGGLPESVRELQPFWAEDGVFLMLDPEAPDVSAAEEVAPTATTPGDDGLAVEPLWPPDAWRRVPRSEAATRVQAMADHASASSGATWPLRFLPGAVKHGASAERFQAYCTATDFLSYRSLHADYRLLRTDGPTWWADLVDDFRTGKVAAPASPGSHQAFWVSVARPAASYARETAEIARIDALEPQPLPNSLPDYDVHPESGEDPRAGTGAYHAGVRVLRAALMEDHQGFDDPLGGTGPGAWGVDAGCSIPVSLALMATPTPNAPVAPSSVAAARRLADFNAPFGWLAAITKEIRRVEGFGAWELATMAQMRADRALYGEGRVSIGYIVAVLTCKHDPQGDPREPGVLNKFRVAAADKTDAASGLITHSNCADDISNRIITAIAPAIGATQDSLDVGGAYFHGIPPTMEEGGRRFYVRIPPWLAALFPGTYPLRARGGGLHLLLVTGNMPGRCDAGRIWQRRFDTFLLGYGLTQLLTDRRVFIGHSERGSLIIHDHVDDSRITSTTVAARDHFHLAWANEFGESIEVKPPSEDFTGLRHTRLGPLTTAISCEGVIRRLELLLEPHPLAVGVKCKWPLPAVALARLSAGVGADVLPPDMSDKVAPILGTIGFIVGTTRPDAYFAFCVLARYAGPLRLTQYAFDCVIRLAHYIVATRTLHLHITTPPLSRLDDGSTRLDLIECFVDSSNGNAEHGASYGGFVLSSMAQPGSSPGATGTSGSGMVETRGGGAIAWKCSAPRAGDDSSAASELRQATLAYKYVLAARFLLTELEVGVAPHGPTPFHLDAQAVLDGTNCERLAKSSRWMAMRYAMLRWGVACGSIGPRKRHTTRNPADGLTKCLTGAPFENARARLLGYPVPHPEL